MERQYDQCPARTPTHHSDHTNARTHDLERRIDCKQHPTPLLFSLHNPNTNDTHLDVEAVCLLNVSHHFQLASVGRHPQHVVGGCRGGTRSGKRVTHVMVFNGKKKHTTNNYG